MTRLVRGAAMTHYPADPLRRLGPCDVLHGDALHLPLDDNSVDLIVTSPPYFALRSYTDGGQHYAGQLGSEATVAEFIDRLLAATREMVRVLKPTGSIFVNLGDKSGSASNDRPKSRLLIPERYRIACVDQLGLIARAVIIWSKLNGLPESVTDRVRCSHEDWVHLVAQPRYYSAVDEIREGYANPSKNYGPSGGRPNRLTSPADERGGTQARVMTDMSPLGKVPGSVREVPSQPLTVPAHLGVDHFAAFPVAWPLWFVQGWSPPGICTACGEGRRPVADRERIPVQATHNGHMTAVPDAPDGRSSIPHVSRTTITGYACACTPTHAEPAPTDADPDRTVTVHDWHLWTAAPTTPGIVLDPFGGTGTTALAARSLGRHGITVDLSRDYCRLAQWRVTDPGELARTRGLDKPPPEHDDQPSLLDLFSEEATA